MTKSRVTSAAALSLLSGVAIYFLTLALPEDTGTSIPAHVQAKLPKKKRPVDRPAATGADEALRWMHRQRAYPNDELPADGLMKAFARSAAQNRPAENLTKNSDTRYHKGVNTQSVIDTGAWSAIGPDNIGGRTLAIAVHPATPDVIFIGAASGGLWKTTTRGVGAAAWSYVNTGFPLVSVSSIVIDKMNPNNIVIGTGETRTYEGGTVGTPGARITYGLGILRSTDGGASWQPSDVVWQFSQQRAVQRIVAHPVNTNILYAATTEGVYKTTDSGATWTPVLNVLMAMDIVINPGAPDILYCACGQRGSPNAGMYKTTNGGASWVNQTSGLPASNIFGRTALGIYADALSGAGEVVYAGVSRAQSNYGIIGIYKTTNGGAAWTQISTTNYTSGQGWYNNVLTVHPANPNIFLAAGLDIYKSTNGTSLSQKSLWFNGFDGVIPPGGQEGTDDYSHADHHAIVFAPDNPNTVYFGNDGGFFVSTDGGETFQGRNGGYQTTQFYSSFANANDNSLLATGGLQDNGQVLYTGNKSWAKVYGGDGGQSAINPQNSQVMYEEYVYLAISKSTTGGLSWFDATTGIDNAGANFIAPFTIAQSNGEVLYAGTTRVYKTTNGAASWTATNNGAPLNGTSVCILECSKNSTDTVYAGTGQNAGGTPRIFRTTNGGATWQDVHNNFAGGLPNRFPTDFYTSVSGAKTCFLTFSGFGNPHVFKTTDAGASWINITGNLPDMPVQSVLQHPRNPDLLFIGTDLGVYKSTNGGATWTEFNEGMPPAMVLDVTLVKTSGNLRVATFGHGIYERALSNAALPVELISFTASPTGSGIKLSWTTASETNNLGFEVERKEREAAWKKAGFVSGNGTTTEQKTYTFTDNSPAPGKQTYRLKQTDFDGKFAYSPEVEVQAGKPATFRLGQNYPNPFNPETNITYEVGTASEVSLKVFDMLGREVAALVNERQSAGQYQVRFNAARLSSGVYFYTLQAGSFIETKKLTLVK